MADVIKTFDSWKPSGDKKESAEKASTLSTFDDWKPPGKEEKKHEPSEPGIKTLARGARQSADMLMGTIGVDLRKPEPVTEKPKNFVQKAGQDMAQASHAEVEEQKVVGPQKARIARAAGAATGIPRLGEDLHNTRSGLVYQGGEAIKGLTGRNPVADLWQQAAAKDSSGNLTAPALAGLLAALGADAPTHAMADITEGLGRSTGAPNIVRSGQGDIINAIPIGNAQRVSGAIRAVGEGAGIAGALTAVTEAGRETAETGRTFNTGRVAKEAAKSAIIGGAASGLVHVGTHGFNRTPSGNRADAHARDTVVSKTPIEPVPKSVSDALGRSKSLDKTASREGRVVDRVLEANKNLSEAERAARAPTVPDKTRAAEGAERVSAVRGKFDEIEADRQMLKQRREQAESDALHERAYAGKDRIDDYRGKFDEIEADRQMLADRRASEETANRAREAISNPDNVVSPNAKKTEKKVGYVRDYLDSGATPVDKDRFLKQLGDEPAKKEAPEPTKPEAKPLVEQMTGGRTKEELQAIVDDRAGSDHETRREAQLELKKQNKPKRREPLELKAGKKPPEYDGPHGDEIAHGEYEVKHFGPASEKLSGSERNMNNQKKGMFKKKRDKYWSVWDATNASSLTDAELHAKIAQIEENAQYRHTAANERTDQHNYTRLTNERDRREYRRKHGRSETWAQPDYEKMTDQELTDLYHTEDQSVLDAATAEMDRRYSHQAPPPEAPAAVAKKDDHIGTRAEYKEKNIEHRPATVAEAIKYGPAAESAGEYYYLRAHHRAGLEELARKIGAWDAHQITKTKGYSALSAEARAIHEQIAEKVAKMRELAGEEVGPGAHAVDSTLLEKVKTGELRGKDNAEKSDHLQRIEEQMNAAKKKYEAEKAKMKKEGRDHPRALRVKTARGDVLLESYNQLPKFTEKQAKELFDRDMPDEAAREFEKTHGEWLELKAAKDKDGSYIGADWDKLTKFIAGEVRDFLSDNPRGSSGTGQVGASIPGLALHYGEKAVQMGKDLKEVWANQFVNDHKASIKDFLNHQATIDAVLGKPKLAQRLGDNIKLALAMKNDLDWVRGYAPELARGLEGVRSRMEEVGRGVSKLSEDIGAREEFARATDMTAAAVKEHQWKHLKPDQVEFIADIAELRAEAADMISHTWDEMDTHGGAKSMRAMHLERYYKAWTHGVDIRTGKRVPQNDFIKFQDHLQSGVYDAMVTANKRIHALHIVDALTMGMSVVHPKNLAKSLVEIIKNPEVRQYLDSYQGTTVYRESRAAKPSLFDKTLGKYVEASARIILGEKGLKVARLWEGGWMERHKVTLIRGAAILKAGKEMGYSGNLLQDLAREHATGKEILNPIDRTDASLRMLTMLEDAFGYNPAGFVNRNVFKQLGVDRVFPFMGIRSVQNRLIGKYIAERNWKSMSTLLVMTQAFAGGAALWAPVEVAMKEVAPELYLRFKPILDLASFAGATEAVGRKSGVINEGNEQYITPFLRHIEHIQPEIAPWLFNPPELINGVFDFSNGLTPAKMTLLFSAAMGGSNLAGITTPAEMEQLWRRLDKGLHGEVTEVDGKKVGGKKMGVYEKGILGEKRHGTKDHIPTNVFREMWNHVLPQQDAIDGEFMNEGKYGSIARTVLMRHGKTTKEVNSILEKFYEDIHDEKRAAEAEDFIHLLKENNSSDFGWFDKKE
jgi:hypothetical protein